MTYYGTDQHDRLDHAPLKIIIYDEPGPPLLFTVDIDDTCENISACVTRLAICHGCCPGQVGFTATAAYQV